MGIVVWAIVKKHNNVASVLVLSRMSVIQSASNKRFSVEYLTACFITSPVHVGK